MENRSNRPDTAFCTPLLGQRVMGPDLDSARGRTGAPAMDRVVMTVCPAESLTSLWAKRAHPTPYSPSSDPEPARPVPRESGW
ncbi:hypothetical protein LIER_43598 [Lithospermum erythrorhizon]|uniref:Uncharacterized protein n=1 Tax=Lithospermum erythrorhizon TaxID=34254 RepID=A0AAV3QI11_LITER